MILDGCWRKQAFNTGATRLRTFYLLIFEKKQHDCAQFYTSHPSIHQVIHILLDIQSETYLKIYSIEQQNINKPRKEQEENIAFINSTWEKKT